MMRKLAQFAPHLYIAGLLALPFLTFVLPLSWALVWTNNIFWLAILFSDKFFRAAQKYGAGSE